MQWFHIKHCSTYRYTKIQPYQSRVQFFCHFARYAISVPQLYTELFSAIKIENFTRKKNDIFLIFGQNIGCGYTLEPPRRSSFLRVPTIYVLEKKYEKGIPLYTQFYLYKSGVYGGIHYTDIISLLSMEYDKHYTKIIYSVKSLIFVCSI